MSNQEINRKRGLILTTQGFRKLKQKIQELEYQNNWGEKYSPKKLSDISKVSLRTISRILNQNEGVDKNSIRLLFQAFDLELLPCDYQQSKSEILEKHNNKNQDWGLAVDVSDFHDQEKNIATLKDWILKENCRLILLLGMGGVGKTYLAIKVAQLIQDQFDFVIWRSLKEDISSPEIINDWVSFLSKQQNKYSLTELLNYLRSHKVLLIVDNLESIIETNDYKLNFQKKYDSYRYLFKILGTRFHQSCVIVTSREKPEFLNYLEDQLGKIRSLNIEGEACSLIALNYSLNQNLKNFTNCEYCICSYYNNNYYLFKIILKYIEELFNSDLNEFNAQNIRIFNEVASFLGEHFERISELELIIINQFKDQENPLKLETLRNSLPDIPQSELLLGLKSLIARSLIIQENSHFTIKPIIRDYLQQLDRKK